MDDRMKVKITLKQKTCEVVEFNILDKYCQNHKLNYKKIYNYLQKNNTWQEVKNNYTITIENITPKFD